MAEAGLIRLLGISSWSSIQISFIAVNLTLLTFPALAAKLHNYTAELKVCESHGITAAPGQVAGEFGHCFFEPN